jgi:hypothetical protein
VQSSVAFDGTYAVEIYVDESNSYVYISQSNVAVVGEEYTLSFWVKADAACTLTFESFINQSKTVSVTTEWKKYTTTHVAEGTILRIKRSGATGITIWIDKVRLEATPVKYAVVTGSLSQDILSPDPDFTKSGFGNVKAAIVISCNAYVGSNPTLNSNINVGFWDGTTQVCCATGEQDNQTTTDCGRILDATKILRHFYSTTDYYTQYSISNITDGVRITLTEDNTGASRYATVILIGGADVEAEVDTFDAATDTDVTSLSFRPDLLLCSGAGFPVSTDIQTFMIWCIGAAIFRPSVIQRCLHAFSRVSVTTSETSSRLTDNHLTGQLTNGGVLTWASVFNSFNAGGFKLTTAGTTGGDDYATLALKVPGINFDIHTLTIPGSTGNQVVTGVGFKPALLLIGMCNGSAIDTTTEGMATSIGASDGTTTAAHATSSQNGLTTTNTTSAYSDSNIVYLPTEAGSSRSEASLVSFDDDGYTLNWTNVTGAGKVGFVIAFQDPNDCKKFVGTSGGKIYFKQ